MVSVVNDYLSGVHGEEMLSVICMVMDTIDLTVGDKITFYQEGMSYSKHGTLQSTKI